MLACLIVRHDPQPARFIGIEEPENYLHRWLPPELAEECQAAIEHSHLPVATHSPFFLNAMRPEQVRVLYRDDDGFTGAVQASCIPRIREFVAARSVDGPPGS